jgi:lipopolysaccharide biosynthesis glycosyltransferase
MDSNCPGGLLQVAYASDENYVPVMGVSLMSLLDRNRDLKEIRIYILDDGIRDESRAVLEELAASYGQGREIRFISAVPLLEAVGDKIKSYGCVPNGNTTFARLFLSDLLPDLRGRLLYIDCDTLVGGSLAPLLELDMGGRCIGMVHDCISREYLGVLPVKLEHYHNAGFLLVDLDAWKAKDAESLLLKGLAAGYGTYPLPDQDMLNMSLRDEIVELDFRYNFQSPFFLFSAGQLAAVYRQDYFREHAEEFAKAKRSVTIAHFSGNSFIRPWYANSNHPWKSLYDSYYFSSPWKDRAQKRYDWERHYWLQHFFASRLPSPLAAAACSLMQRVFMYTFYHNWGKGA